MTSKITQANKQTVWKFWNELESAETSQITTVIQKYVSDDIVWIGPSPINRLEGAQEIYEKFWEPLLSAFSDLKRDSFIFFGGPSNGKKDGSEDGQEWVGGLGYFNGTFENDWLTIPASGKATQIRWSEFCRLEEGKIKEIHILLDVPDVMRQAGYPVLPPDKGAIGVWNPPNARDGVLLDEQDDSESLESMQLIRAMIYDGLNSFDQDELKSMGMADFFRDDLQWYGPSGIGTCLSLREFEDLHQKPWLVAFPDRQVQDLDSLITEGRYMGGTGWAGVIATHSGPYLDTPASNNTVRIDGIDIWAREGNQLTENWVFVDMIALFDQFGVDLFARMHNRINS